MVIWYFIFLIFLPNQFHGLKTKYINYKEEDEIAFIDLNNQNRNDFLNLETLEEIENIIDNININKIHGLIITHTEEENYFISGRNKNYFKNFTKEEFEEILRKKNKLFLKIESIPILVISAFSGIISGFKFELSLYSDIRICSEETIFSFSEVNSCINPGFEITQKLSQIIGLGMTKQVIFTRQNINSEEALRIKLVNDIYPKNELLDNAKKYVMYSKRKGHLLNKGYTDNIIFHIRIKYETKLNENIYIYGNNSDFGDWKQPNFKLHWSKGNIWQHDYAMLKTDNCIQFKFVCHSNSYDIWEKGDNRLLCPKNLKSLPKTNDGKYILDFIWNHFKINFNIHYPPPNKDTLMQISGSPSALPKWQSDNNNPLKMELDDNKQILANDGNLIQGFWTITVIMKTSDKNNFDFEYRYSLFDKKKNSAMWEREPNRHIHIYTNENEFTKCFNKVINDKRDIYLDSHYLLTNSFLEVLDVNFVSDLEFNKIGEKNIFIGPYPQSENDFKKLNENGIDAILNLQSDKDMKIRQINYQFQLDLAKKYGIKINRYPIIDFNQIDLYNKLKGAGDLLNNLIKEGKTIYVHCTAGMSRAAATVIIYLVLHENYNVEEADNFCKKYRPIICPNYGVINKIASEYKPGSEMKGVPLYNFEP